MTRFHHEYVLKIQRISRQMRIMKYQMQDYEDLVCDFSIYGVFHEKGAKFWIYKMGSCGVVFWNKINSFGKSANNPRRKWFVFWKNFILYQVEISEKIQLGTKLSFFKKQIIFFWVLGLFALLPKELILFQNTTPQEPILFFQNLAPFSWKTPYGHFSQKVYPPKLSFWTLRFFVCLDIYRFFTLV